MRQTKQKVHALGSGNGGSTRPKYCKVSIKAQDYYLEVALYNSHQNKNVEG